MFAWLLDWIGLTSEPLFIILFCTACFSFTFKKVYFSLHHSVTPPRFHHTPALQVTPVYQTDREIFDFTDSRFIKPFPENLVNYPLILRSSNDVKTLAPSSHSQVISCLVE